MPNEESIADLTQGAQDEARRVIEKLDTEHISNFQDLFEKLGECIKHAKTAERGLRFIQKQKEKISIS